MLKFIVIPIFLVMQLLSFSSQQHPEDAEIEELKKQISILQEKITVLEKNKELKIKTLKQPKVGLVLSGGGAKGLAHIGVLKTLEENNIKIDYITGTSMGAIVASLYSVGYSADEIEIILHNLDSEFSNNGSPNREDIDLEKRIKNRDYAVSVRYDSHFNFFLPKGIRSNQKAYLLLKSLLWRAEGINDFDKLPIPLRVIATDLDTGEAVAFKSGDLAQAVTASMAIPTLYDPVKIDGTNYVDGLVARNFPVEDILAMGADFVIGVDVGSELKPKESYNFINVLDQLIAIQSSSSNQEQRDLTTVLITPDVKEYKTTDFDYAEELVQAGKDATRKKLSLLRKLPKKNRQESASKDEKDSFIIEKIKISDLKNSSRKEVILGIFSEILNKPITQEKLEKLTLKAYGFDFVNKIYYNLEGSTLVLQVEENPTNVVGLALNYQSDYGTTFALGTNISLIGKKGILTTAEAKFGDYYGFALNNFFYYGVSNKVGAILNLEYDETPFFLYNRGKKISEYLDKSYKLTGGFLTQYDNQALLVYGLTMNYSDFNQTIGIKEGKILEYSKNFADVFLKFTWDKTDKGIYATRGFRGNLDYLWGGGTSGKHTFYGPLYNLEGYLPLTNTLSLNTSIFGGAVNGSEIPTNRYIKLGGTIKNLDKGLLPFYGYHFQEKLLQNVIASSLGIQYELFPNFYIIGKYNIATFSEPSFNLDKNDSSLWKDYSHGVGVGVAYNSILGPIEFSASKSSEAGSGVLQLSVGYFID